MKATGQEKETIIVLRSSLIRFCNGNICAAALCSFFDSQQVGSVPVAYTITELETGILNLYGKNAINAALELLIALGMLSISGNPDPHYKFDKTRFFAFDLTPFLIGSGSE